MKPALLILDVAHGRNTPGKQSPDGLFKEWKWSRDMCLKLINEFFNDILQKDYDVMCPYIKTVNEPGLTNRVNAYNALSEDYKFTYMLSLHNNAASNESRWWRSRTGDGSGGMEIWTDKEHNYSDKLAEVFMEKMMKLAPNEVYRHNTPDDISKDFDFTVIYGYKKNDGTVVRRKYEACLLESLFMDNTVDFKKLIDPEWNREWMKVIGLSAHSVMQYNGYAN